MTKLRHILTFLLLVSSTLSLRAVHSDHRNRKIDSMEVVLGQKDLPWADQLRAHRELMWGYLQTDGEKSIYHAKQILSKTEGVKSEGLMTRLDAFRILGQHAYAVGLYDSALHCYDLSLETTRLAEKSQLYPVDDIDNTYAALYGTIGNLYNIQGMVNLATEYYYKALPYMERQQWTEGISTLYYNIGEMYLEMGNDIEARKAYEKALEVALPTGDSLIIAMPRHGLATVLLNEGKPQEALAEELKSLEYYRNHADEEAGGLMNGLVLLSRIQWQGLGRREQAEATLGEAFGLARDSKVVADVSDVYYVQGLFCYERGEWRKAVDWCKQALATNDQDPHHNISVYKTLCESYAYVGQPDSATKYLNLMHQTMTDMANQRHQTALSEMQVRYETQKKEAQIAQMAEEERFMQWRYLGIAVGVALIALIGVVALWRIHRQQRRVVAAEAKLEGEREERQRLARDLHDRMGGLLTAVRLSIEQNHHAEALHTLEEASTELRRVAHHLMPDSLQRLGLVTALRDYCEALHNVSFTCLGSPRRLTPNQEMLCYSVVHELINNALRHADAERIQVQLMFDDDSFSSVVADNGCGFDLGAPTAGMGLRNIRERIEVAGGEFSMTSEPGNGTEAIFTIKDNK